MKSINIHIRPDLVLYVSSSVEDALFFVDDAEQHGEYQYQLKEGKIYEYEIVDAQGNDSGWVIEGPSAIIKQSQRHKNQGTLTTGNYVGSLKLEAKKTGEENCESVCLEIQSSKMNYRDHYQKMLSDIASYYTDLVMQYSSPVTQKFDIDYEAPQQTLYQKFSFVKSIIQSPQFEESVIKIMSNPVRGWSETISEKRIEAAGRVDRHAMRQIASRQDRVACNAGMAGLNSIPRYISVSKKIDTVDVGENQFVKYVLNMFYGFCSSIQAKKNAKNDDILKRDAEAVCSKISNWLSFPFFRSISSPSFINFGSPVLQRKEGYREILQAWLMFKLAARLNWQGGNNVYEAGKKNVAALYEYWLFFKLLDVISTLFKVDHKEYHKLVSLTNDQLNLEIRQGQMKMISGISDLDGRRLNVSFYYNRTFGYREDMHKAGSWTMPMRPDYTLSIWPGGIDEKEAERDELIVHIHFDAKYRIEKLLFDEVKEIENPDEDVELIREMNDEKSQQEVGTYKRADLLKMHAYKDAIRRTSGAYILYPGDKQKTRKGFHEIIPGLGAFCLSPENEGEQIQALKDFFIKIKEHLLDRTSQRERMAYYHYDTYKEEPKSVVRDELPEALRENRDFIPDRINVIVGYCAKENVKFLTEDNHLYNMRTDEEKGSQNIDTNKLTSKYILLWNEEWQHLYKLSSGGPSIISRKSFVEKGYLTSEMIKKINKKGTKVDAMADINTEGYYLVFKLNKQEPEKELRKYKWDVRKMKCQRALRRSFVITLADMMKYVVI